MRPIKKKPNEMSSSLNWDAIWGILHYLRYILYFDILMREYIFICFTEYMEYAFTVSLINASKSRELLIVHNAPFPLSQM